jgi:hypothetical protein
MVISGRVINTLLIRNTQEDGVTQDYLNFLVFENRAVCEIVKKYCTAEQATDDTVIWHLRIARWVTKATKTRSEHVIRIAFPRQQW